MHIRSSSNRYAGSTRGAILLAIAVTALAALTAGCGSDSDEPSAGGKHIKMATLYEAGGSTDGWNRAFREGTLAAIDKLGKDKVTVKHVVGVPYSTQATQITNQLFQQGHDLVLDTLAAGDLFYEACKDNPDKTCDAVQALGDPPPNTTGHWFKFWESYYLNGVAAGMLTKTGTLGYIGSFKQPYERANINAYVLGCQSVKPDCKVNVIFINTFNDAPKTAEAAQTLINGGADVLASFVATPGPLEIAQKNNAWAFSMWSDQESFGPKALVTGILTKKAIEKEMTLVLGSLLDGKKIPPGPRLYGLADMEIAPWGERVPAEVRERGDALHDEIVGGKRVIVGPLRDQKGKLRVPEGEELSDEFLFEQWDWFVDGVSAR